MEKREMYNIFFRDEFWEATGDYILKRGNYCATHPLAKNSF